LTMDRRQLEKYLALLGVPESDPGPESLRKLVRAHLMNVPFENVSKLFRWKTSGIRGIPDCDEYLHGIERFHFGGTCYTNNYYLFLLLAALGYEVRLCGAGMSRPDVHIVSIVALEGREYIVDAGYGAPFLEPLPRDLRSDHEVSLGTDRYVLSPQNPAGQSRLTLYRDGAVRHGYLVNPAPRRIGEFGQVIADSFRPDATFMNALLLVKFGIDNSVVLHNMILIESKGPASEKTAIGTTGELAGVIERRFSIPGSVSRIALEGVSFGQDAWS